MVVCTYFQRGICNFGSQCRNEHISQYTYRSDSKFQNDMRLQVTSEAESALAGKQWILSCFAPFRDKLGIIIPQFIEDISPEEVRWECYQAEAQGTLPQYTQGLSSKIQDATKKMQMLKSPSSEVMNFLSELYNGTVNTNTNNPFCTSRTTFANSISNNIFGQAPTTVFDKPQPNVFGGSTSNPFTPNNFTQNTIFTTQSQSTNNNVFLNNNTNVFQQGASVTAGMSSNTNIFAKAASSFGQNPTTGPFTSIQPSVNSFSFAIPAQSSASIFGGSASTNSVFSQSSNNTSNNPLFGQPATLGGNIFLTANAMLPITNNTSANSSPMSNIFGGAGQSSSFGSIGQNTFATVAENPCLPTNQQNVFGMNVNQNSFANVQNQSSSGDIFKNSNQQNDIANNPFLSKTNSKSGQSQGLHVNMELNNNVYSKLNDLTEDEIAHFQCDHFELGLIPIHPPAIEMCN